MLVGACGALVVLGALAACSGQAQDVGAVPPGSGRPMPVPMREQGRRPGPEPPTIAVVAGAREREVAWRLVRSSRRSLLVEVQVGGPPCDAVTGALADESSPHEVRLSLWAGRVAGVEAGDCTDIPATLGVARVEIELARPLGDRSLRAPEVAEQR